MNKKATCKLDIRHCKKCKKRLLKKENAIKVFFSFFSDVKQKSHLHVMSRLANGFCQMINVGYL